jgi:uncharacterized membrane protein YqaE (UPF0057 family)
MTLIKLLLCVFFPPLAVLLHAGVGRDLLINIVLTLLGYIPGMIHGMFIVMNTNERSA